MEENKNRKLSILAGALLMASIGTGLGTAGVINHSHLTANADDTNQSNLANGKATDIPDDTTPNWQMVGGFKVDVPRANSQGEFAYCINCGKVGMTKYSGQSQRLTNGYVSNVLCDGQVQAGKQCQYAPLNQLSEPEREMVTQYAIWIALGQGNVQDTGTENANGSELGGTVNNNAFYQKYKGYIDGLLNYAKNNAPVKTTPQDQQQKINDAQNALNKQVQDDVNNQLKSVTQSLENQAHQEQDNDGNTHINQEVSQASKALHISPVAVHNTQATKDKLGAKFDGDDAKGHLDDIQNGSHDFSCKITHGDVQGVNWQNSVKVHFAQPLPKDTEIWVNGKQITKDASTTQDYTMNVGDTYTIKVPFSDAPTPNSDSFKATATFDAKYTAKSVDKQQTVNSDKQQNINFDMVQLGAGYKNPDNPKGQSRAVGYLIAVPSNKQLNAHASQTAKVNLPPKLFSKPSQAQAEYAFNWKQMLGRLVVDKLGVPSDPDAQAQQQITKIESQNDFGNGFNFGKKPAHISADGSDSNFENLAPSKQEYQNGGYVNAQQNANDSKVEGNKVASGNAQTGNQNNSQSNNINHGVATNQFNADGTNKVVPLSDVTFQLVPRSVKQLNVLKQFYPLADGNGSQITLPKITNDKGQLVWDNIPYGDYDLIEVQTANGYVLNRQPIHVGADRYHVGTNNVIVKNKSPQTITIHTTAHNDSNNGDTFQNGQIFKSHDTVAIGSLTKGQGFEGQVAPYDSATGKQIPNTKVVNIQAIGNGEKSQIVQSPSQDINAKDVKGNVVYVETGHTTNTGEGGQANVQANHNDLNDKAETITNSGSPQIHTTATENGGKTRTFSKNEHATDNIAHNNFQAGTYDDIVWALNPDTGKPVDANAPVGRTRYTVKDGQKDFTTTVNYTFDGSKYKGRVVFAEETVPVNGQGKEETNDVYASHKDLNDQNESLLPATLGKGEVIPAQQTAVPVASTPVGTPLQQTGETHHNVGLITMISGAIIGVFGWLGSFFKKRHE